MGWVDGGAGGRVLAETFLQFVEVEEELVDDAPSLFVNGFYIPKLAGVISYSMRWSGGWGGGATY